MSSDSRQSHAPPSPGRRGVTLVRSFCLSAALVSMPQFPLCEMAAGTNPAHVRPLEIFAGAIGDMAVVCQPIPASLGGGALNLVAETCPSRGVALCPGLIPRAKKKSQPFNFSPRRCRTHCCP